MNALSVNGARTQIQGTTQALSGGLQMKGANGIYRCGVIAKTLRISGSGNSVPVDEQCRIR